MEWDVVRGDLKREHQFALLHKIKLSQPKILKRDWIVTYFSDDQLLNTNVAMLKLQWMFPINKLCLLNCW